MRACPKRVWGKSAAYTARAFSGPWATGWAWRTTWPAARPLAARTVRQRPDVRPKAATQGPVPAFRPGFRAGPPQRPKAWSAGALPPDCRLRPPRRKARKLSARYRRRAECRGSAENSAGQTCGANTRFDAATANSAWLTAPEESRRPFPAGAWKANRASVRFRENPTLQSAADSRPASR